VIIRRPTSQGRPQSDHGYHRSIPTEEPSQDRKAPDGANRYDSLDRDPAQCIAIPCQRRAATAVGLAFLIALAIGDRLEFVAAPALLLQAFVLHSPWDQQRAATVPRA
jgi:hypothetical protein